MFVMLCLQAQLLAILAACATWGFRTLSCMLTVLQELILALGGLKNDGKEVVLRFCSNRVVGPTPGAGEGRENGALSAVRLAVW